jgi:hypothetical protein
MRMNDLRATAKDGKQYPAWPIPRAWLPDRGIFASAVGAVLVDVQPYKAGGLYLIAEREGERLHNHFFWDGAPTADFMLELLRRHIGHPMDTLGEIQVDA